jgi:hypothetical protein
MNQSEQERINRLVEHYQQLVPSALNEKVVELANSARLMRLLLANAHQTYESDIPISLAADLALETCLAHWEAEPND